jgi:protein-arginine kinase activator protein McsA
MNNCPISGSPCNEQKNYLFSETIDGESNCLRLCQMCIASSFNTPKMLTIQVKKCPECGMTFKKIKEIGKLGCINCLNFFGEEITSVLKVPFKPQVIVASNTIESKIQELKDKLDRAVEEEKYETAAACRDLIKEHLDVLEKKQFLKAQLDEAVVDGDIEKATELRLEISAMDLCYSKPKLINEPNAKGQE